MCLKQKNNFFNTVTIRLTLWCTGLFSILLLVIFVFIYISLGIYLMRQVDDDLMNEAKEMEAFYVSHVIKVLQEEFKREADSNGVSNVFYRLLSKDGMVLATSDMSNWRGLNTVPLLSPGDSMLSQTTSIGGHKHKDRIFTKRMDDGNILQLGVTLQSKELLMQKYLEILGTALAAMIIMGIFLGWFIAKRAMSGVVRVTAIATRINSNALNIRVPLNNEGQEIDSLINAFNAMLERIEVLVRDLQEVTDNIAHDLRSPITRIRGISEITLTSEQNITAYQDMAQLIIEESDRQIEMINTMLEITKAETAIGQLNKERVEIRKIVEEAHDLFQPLAENKGITIDVHVPVAPVFVMVEKKKLQRVIANLLDNAIKYSYEGGRVAISVALENPNIIIEVADNGIGIDKEDLPRIFERFYRCEKSRSTPGSGLGLSLAKAFVQAHAGNINVKSTPEKGSIFSLSLPIS
jgi:heavy metal sensor kinase